MGRFVGLSVNNQRGKGSGGGGSILSNEAFTRATGITTNSDNNVTSVILGENKYESILYNAVGLVTGYNEIIGSDEKGWALTYDSKNLIDTITEVDTFPTYSLTSSATNVDEGSTVSFTVTTTKVSDGTTLYWKVSSEADFTTSSGNFTINSNTGTFDCTPSEDTTTEGTESFMVDIFVDAGFTQGVGSSPSVTINDTSEGANIGGHVFHAGDWNTQASYDWTVPAGVTAISVVCVGGGGAGETNHDAASGGGGGLAYKNGLAVTPGQTVTVKVGAGGFATSWGVTDSPNGQDSYIQYGGTVYARANGGMGGDGNQSDGWYNNSNSFPNTNSDGGGQGGSGYHQGGCRQSGGGCGGYNGGGGSSSGRCGNPGYSGQQGQAGQNGGGGGACSNNGAPQGYSAGGGGTGVYGEGTNGVKGDANNNGSNEGVNDFCGGGGSTAYNTGLRGYSNDSSNSEWASGTNLGNNYDRNNQMNQHGQGGGTTPDGGFPGGGAGGANGSSPAGWGGNGIVRIVWGQVSGVNRSFPSTNVDRTDQYDATVTEDVSGVQRQY